MGLADPHRLVRYWPGALLALLAGLVAGSAETRAACGGHAMARHSAQGESSQLDLLSRIGALSDPVESEPTPAGPAPCTGAMCSKRPEMPPPTSTTLVERSPQWAIRPSRPPGPDSDSRAVSRENRVAPPLHVASAIFHPPR
jgi:hypothetical protein